MTVVPGNKSGGNGYLIIKNKEGYTSRRPPLAGFKKESLSFCNQGLL